MTRDARLTPARPDLAARFLEGVVDAPRYADGTVFQAAQGTAPVRRAPASDAPLDTELLFGEHFTAYEVKDGWAWGQSGQDGYVGYVPMEMLAPEAAAPTHMIRALRSFVFPAPDLKTPPLDALSTAAKLCVTEAEGRFLALAGGGYVFQDHVVALGTHEPDAVAVAETFLGVPYLWGGKSSFGLDCSGLVQIALERAGLDAPRDADQQEAALGTALDDGAPPRRGDLVFWKGHVGVMTDAEHFIHANATYMAVTVNVLERFAAQVAESTGPVTSIRRLDQP